MFAHFRENPIKALIILLIPLLVVSAYLLLVVRFTLDVTDGYMGAVLDDTWIHVRFAYHLSQGEGLAFNEGVITPGATSPLWVLLLGALYAITNPETMTQVHMAIGLSAAGTLLAVSAITGFGWYATQRAWVGLLAGLLTAVTGRFIWMGLSGMEITTFAALCIIAMWSHMADIREDRVFGWRTGILTALATLARPEGYLLAVIIGLDAFVLVPLLERRNILGTLRTGWRGIVAYVLLAGSYPIACLLMTGYPLPNTFRAKSQLGREVPELPRAFFWQPNVDYTPVVILLAGAGIAYLLWLAWTKRARIGFAWAMWPVVFVLAVLFLGAQHFVVNNSRYVAPAIPFHMLAAAVGVWAVVEGLARVVANPRLLQRVIPLMLGVLLIGVVLYTGRDQGPRVANDVSQLRQMHVTAAAWFLQNTEPGQRIALNDVGAITHITDRPVLDLVGLVSPEVLDAIAQETRMTCEYDLELMRVMVQESPALIGVFPWWFPCMVAWPELLQPFNVFEIRGTTVLAGGELVVYWPQWEHWPLQREIPAAAAPVNVDFEQGISLAALETAQAENGLTLTLWWRAHEQPQGDYTVFAHVIDLEGNIVAQRDSIPQDGRFNTLWWRSGDLIPDTRLIEFNDPALLQRDDLTLRIGLYQTGAGVRLPRIAAPPDQTEFVLIEL
ncbi:MAG: hypothetical protein OHK0046_20560 [Anaerolineae bacterium]